MSYVEHTEEKPRRETSGYIPRIDGPIFTTKEAAFQAAQSYVNQSLNGKFNKLSLNFRLDENNPFNILIFKGYSLEDTEKPDQKDFKSAAYEGDISLYRDDNTKKIIGWCIKLKRTEVRNDPYHTIKFRYDEHLTGEYEKDLGGSWDVAVGAYNGKKKETTSRHFAFKKETSYAH